YRPRIYATGGKQDRRPTLTLGTASGGTNWPGGSYDPETHTVYAYACNACVTPIGLVRPPKEFSDMNFVAGTAGQELRMRAGPGENSGADAILSRAGAGGAGGRRGWWTSRGRRRRRRTHRAPLIKPPYATIAAINLDRGDIVWQTAHGETPNAIRNHPA